MRKNIAHGLDIMMMKQYKYVGLTNYNIYVKKYLDMFLNIF